MTQKKLMEKYNSIDLAKFIFAIFVIAIHTHPFEIYNGQKWMEIYNTIVNLSVPFFFIVTGFLLSKKIEMSQSEARSIVIKNKLISVLKMYLLWMIVYTPLSVCHSILEKQSLTEAALLYIRGLFFIGQQYNSWPLWYLLATIYALICIIVLMRFKVTYRGLLCVAIVFCVISITVDCIVDAGGNIPSVLVPVQKILYYSIASGRIFRGMVYIPIGMYLANKSFSDLVNVLLLISGLIISVFVEYKSLDTLLMIIIAVGLFGIIEKIKLKDSKIYPVLRNASTILYLIHMYVWTFYYSFVYGTKTYGADSFVVTVLVSCIIAFGYIFMKNRRKRRDAGNYH